MVKNKYMQKTSSFPRKELLGPRRTNNIINHNFIDYIIRNYLPELADDAQYQKMKMEYFRQAMAHESSNHSSSYERLEFLGDAVFHVVISDYIYHRYYEENEGFMTKLRIRIERGDTMAQITKRLKLHTVLQIGSDQSHCMKIYEDIFESFIGAFYLNFGYEYSKKFVISIIEKTQNFTQLLNHDDNYKDLLLRFYHQKNWNNPVYHLECVKNKKYHISIKKNNKVIGTGVNCNKKIAEQLASYKALENYGLIVDGVVDSEWFSKNSKEKKAKKALKKMPVINEQNKLMKTHDVKQILSKYNVNVSKLKFKLALFTEAMTHKSYLIRSNLCDEDKEKKDKCVVKLQKRSNEKLRFLGDAVIRFLLTDILFQKFPTQNEGYLSKVRSNLENDKSLYKLSKNIGLVEYIIISNNIEINYGRDIKTIVRKSLEAFFGALYLSSGMQLVRVFMDNLMLFEINMEEVMVENINFKDEIISLCNKKKWGLPCFKILKAEGSDNHKHFTVGLFIKNKYLTCGKGYTKKSAEQIASKNLLDKINKY